MAVFMINICKFDDCGVTFPKLPELIAHIEEVHIDYDPIILEQKEASQPACIHLSYVLRFYTRAPSAPQETPNPQLVAEVRRHVLPVPDAPSARSSTPTGSEIDEEEVSASEDSNDSWTTVQEYSSEYILRYGVKMNATAASGALGPAAQEKPFGCPVPGCKKRYKNVNGIKYHSKNGHKKDGRVKKAYRCHCGKSYKTTQGLKTHTHARHTMHGRTAPVVVTADKHKLVRIYEALNNKELHGYTIPKLSHNHSGPKVTVQNTLAQNQNHSGPKVTVQSQSTPAHSDTTN